MPLVLDASTTLAWAFVDEHNELADRALGTLSADYAVVPEIWSLEVANALVIAERRGRITWADTQHFIADLLILPIQREVGDLISNWLPTIELARRENLSMYHASYLSLAARLGLPLATLDQHLLSSARNMGIALFT